MISKLKAAEPILDELGQHKTYTNEKYNTTYYKFKLTFEDGTVGEANSTKPEGNYKVGEEYEITVNENKYAVNGKRLSVKLHQQRGAFAKKDPKTSKEILVLVAFEVTAEFARNTTQKISIPDIATDFADFLSKEIHEGKKDPITLQGTLRRAVMFLGTESFSGGNVESVCKLALAIYKKVKEYEWKSSESTQEPEFPA